MNDIKEFVEIIKENGGEASFLEICDKYQKKYKDSLSQNQKITIARTLNSDPNVIYLNQVSKKWQLVTSKKQVFKNNDNIAEQILSLFDNGYFIIENKKQNDGQIRYRIAIPGDYDACDILISSVNYKIYSYKKLNEISDYFTKYSERTDEHRPYQYQIPIKSAANVNICKSTTNMIVCRVAYMSMYNGISNEDQPANGGAYVEETGDAEEKYNFSNIDGKCYGFVETKHNKNGENNKLIIDNIDKSYKDEEIAKNVRVVFVALNPKTRKTVVVGWYDKADVYRTRQYLDVHGKEHQYNIVCDFENANLIEDGRRTFEIPNAAREGNEFGMGQSNVWYIQNNAKAKDFEKELVNYLNNVVI